jgi:hypothetical protein
MRNIAFAYPQLSKTGEFEDARTVAWWLDFMASLSYFPRICGDRLKEAAKVYSVHCTDYIGFLGRFEFY